MGTQNILVSLVICIVCRIGCGTTRRCFECHHASIPQGCGNITICNSDEYCFTEQFVTSTGNVVFDSGCVSQSQCTRSTRRVQLIGKRTGDISICKECCSDDYCNMRGCGLPEIPLGMRGPYCFHCDAMQDPSACRRVLPCSQGELCAVYSYRSLDNGDIRSTCVEQSICDTLMQTNVDQNCGAKCCLKDFCNDQCGAVPNGSMASQAPNTQSTRAVQVVVTLKGGTLSHTRRENSTTTSTPQPSNTSEPEFDCDTRGGYVHLFSQYSQLCVHLVHKHVTWPDARSLCEKEEGHLVILDTRHKAELLRNELNANSQHSEYWIGASDVHGHDRFRWVNSHHIHESEADWASGQPDNVVGHHDQDCVAMERSDDPDHSFQWHDKRCSHQVNYICER